MEKFFKNLGSTIGSTTENWSWPGIIGGFVTALLATWVF